MKEIAVFASASDSFSKKNVNCSALEALDKIKVLMEDAKKQNLKIRGYVSCIVGCPYEGMQSRNNTFWDKCMIQFFNESMK